MYQLIDAIFSADHRHVGDQLTLCRRATNRRIAQLAQNITIGQLQSMQKAIPKPSKAK